MKRLLWAAWIVVLLGLAAGRILSQDEPPPEEPQEQNPPPSAGPQETPQEEPAITPDVAGESEPPTVPDVPPSPPKPPKTRRSVSSLPASPQQKRDALEAKLEALAPKGIYLLIDTGTNHLYLMRNRCVLRVALCSTGSGRFLPDPPRRREWTFDTPKGEFRIQRKVLDPVWNKPDWAFIEEGEEIPKKQADRLAPEELGDYAMDLGDGYLIHGTLYERSLGLSVTHGCVRLGAKDLEAIFKSVKIGTRVYIF
ncbi:MAG TPA: L,D-transpeptidase [Candidatus Polarisedimenticolia bacterium]|nr:L,D-transpeptidase [Candidatus Polarisedimenticolia bacterium]